MVYPKRSQSLSKHVVSKAGTSVRPWREESAVFLWPHGEWVLAKAETERQKGALSFKWFVNNFHLMLQRQ